MPAAYLRATAASELRGPQVSKSPEVMGLEVQIRETNLRTHRLRAQTAQHRTRYDMRQNALHLGSARAHQGRWADVRSGDFGLLPSALPLQERRRLRADPVERALEALQRRPEGWLVYDEYMPKYIRDRIADAERARDDRIAVTRRKAEEEAAAQAATEAAAAAAAEREVIEHMAALDAELSTLRGEVEAKLDRHGALV